MPARVKVATDAWAAAACVADGRVFRSVNRADAAQGDALRRRLCGSSSSRTPMLSAFRESHPTTCAARARSLCRAGGGELEQIQMLLGHAFVQITERSLGTKQDLVHTPNDGIKLRVAV